MAIVAFAVGAVISLGTSWVLVTRLERLGERVGLSEALLGLVAALAADTPEITSAVTAVVHHERAVGSGVVIGSNVFNLAALLGLGAIVAGRIELHRKVVVLGGAVASWVALVSLVCAVGLIGPLPGLVLVLVVLVPYVVLLGTRRRPTRRRETPPRWQQWLRSAVVEEESELEAAIRPRPGTRGDAVAAVASMVVVVGGLILAAVTSLPNAVAGVYLASRGRGAAMLSTTLSSNTFNIVLGLLLPAVFVGLALPSRQQTLIVAWYGALTVITLAFAYVGRGLRGGHGWMIVAGYAGFVAVLLAVS